jgi:hypothetical protein
LQGIARRTPVQELRLVGVSDDGARVILVDEAGARFAVPLDDRLRAAVRVDRTRLGKLEIDMNHEPSPRDVQSAIRAGGSAQDVAEAFGVSVEWVERYARPVLGERVHVLNTAMATAARRGGGADQPSLGALVSERLAERGVDPSSLEWDAWRREDGKWSVRLDYVTSNRPRHAQWQYDTAGRYLMPDDDEARWLVAEESRDQVVPFGRRPAADEPAAEEPAAEQGTGATAEETGPDQHDTIPLERPESGEADSQGSAAAAGSARKKGRASVPSWDDIVFGSRRSSD